MILKKILPSRSNQTRELPLSKYLFVFILFIFVAMSLQQTVTATELTDQSGKIIRFAHPFARIISLYAAHTENLAHLGLEKEIIGRTGEDDYPLSVITKPEFSDRDDPEKFIAAHPDLVLVRPMIESSHPELFIKLEQAGIAVVSLQPTTVDQMFAYWRDLGKLTGKTEQAETMITEFKAGLIRIEKTFANVPEKKRPRVYFESIHSKMRTFSPDSITIFSLKSAGGVNIALDAIPRHATNIAEYGKERLLSHADEIDVFLAQTGRMNRIEKTMILEEPGFRVIKAIRDNRVQLIDEKLVSRPTMRLLLGIEQLNSILYPSHEQQTGNR
jgi:iron complex transport system substrate-binding protein